MAEKNSSNEIKITRVYDAPVEMVWDAWTDPAQVALWWGPRGFTLTTHSKDLREGGHWSYTMHGPDGVDYPNKTLYHEVIPLKKLVYDHGASDDSPALFRVSVTFSDRSGKTLMEMTMTLPTAEAAAQTRVFIKKAGGESTWDRLAEYIEKKENKREIFVINRTFNASVDAMFEMWTNPKHFSQWLAPTGFSMKFIREEAHEGGCSFFSMSNGEGMTMYGTVRYLEISRPHRIVYTQQFCDEKEQISRHPGAPTWPETMRTTVILSEESTEQTRVTLVWTIEGSATTEEIDAFIAERAGMTQGWTGSFDKLEKYLS